MTWPRNRPERILQLLAGHPQGLPTPEIAELLGEPYTHHLLCHCGRALRSAETRCRAVRAGTAPGRGKADIWRITDAGRDWLAWKAAKPAERLKRDAALAEAAAQKAETARLLTEARELYDRSTTTAARRKIARELFAAGCSKTAIATVFGVSRELIRLELLAGDTGPLRRTGGPLRLGARRVQWHAPDGADI